MIVIKILHDITEYKIQQITDNGKTVQLSLLENVNTESISQKQLVMESLQKKLDSEVQKQILPILDAIMKIQPTIKIKSYQQISITILMPKIRYMKMGSPKVGEKLEINMQKLDYM